MILSIYQRFTFSRIVMIFCLLYPSVCVCLCECRPTDHHHHLTVIIKLNNKVLLSKLLNEWSSYMPHFLAGHCYNNYTNTVHAHFNFFQFSVRMYYYNACRWYLVFDCTDDCLQRSPTSADIVIKKKIYCMCVCRHPISSRQISIQLLQ